MSSTQPVEQTIRQMRELTGASPFIAPRSGRRARFKDPKFTTPKKTKDQIRKARKTQRKNRRKS